MAAPVRGESLGAYLRRAREARSMSVGELSRATRISASALERIEADHFDDLPGEVFTRGFLKAYAATVGLSPNEVLARYTAARRSVAVEPLPLATPVAGRGARRFGFAVAFVVLVVLFTLALSMVLRPRGHDRPPELSSAPETQAQPSAMVAVPGRCPGADAARPLTQA